MSFVKMAILSFGISQIVERFIPKQGLPKNSSTLKSYPLHYDSIQQYELGIGMKQIVDYYE